MDKFDFKNYRLENYDEWDPNGYNITNYNGRSGFAFSKTATAEINVNERENLDGSKNILITLSVNLEKDKYSKTIETNSNDIKNFNINLIMENLMVFDYCLNNQNPFFKKEDAERFATKLYRNIDNLIEKKNVENTPSEIVGNKIYEKAFNRSEKQSSKIKDNYYDATIPTYGE